MGHARTVYSNNKQQKTYNFRFIYDQLRESKVQKMALLLQKSGSSYWPTFQEMYNNVEAGVYVCVYIYFSNPITQFAITQFSATANYAQNIK